MNKHRELVALDVALNLWRGVLIARCVKNARTVNRETLRARHWAELDAYERTWRA